MAQSGSDEKKGMFSLERIALILSVLGLIASGGYNASSYMFKTDAAERSMTELKLTVAEANKARDVQYAEIMRRMESVPLQGQALTQLTSQVNSLAQVLSNQDARLNRLDAQAAVFADAIAGIRAASGVKLR